MESDFCCELQISSDTREIVDNCKISRSSFNLEEGGGGNAKIMTLARMMNKLVNVKDNHGISPIK